MIAWTVGVQYLAPEAFSQLAEFRGQKELPAPMILAEVRASRTHRRPLRTTAGFEDREDHRSLSTSILQLQGLHYLTWVEKPSGTKQETRIRNHDTTDATSEGRWMCQQDGS